MGIDIFSEHAPLKHKFKSVKSGEDVSGLVEITKSTKLNTVISEFNDILAQLAPAQPLVLDGNPTYQNITFYTGFVASGVHKLDTYSNGSNIGSISKNDVSFEFLTPNTSTMFGKADKGYLELRINGSGVDTFDLATSFYEDDRDGNQGANYDGGNGIPVTSPTGFITIISVGKYNDFKAWQKGNTRINLSALQQGENDDYQLFHIVGSNTYSLTSGKWFYDNGSSSSTITNREHFFDDSSSKYLDGVKYMSTSDKVTYNFDIQNAFSNTYNYTFARIDGGSLFANNNVNIDDSDVSDVSTIPVFNEIASISGRTRSITTSDQYAITTTLGITKYKPGYSATENSVISNFLLNTYSVDDTGLVRNFHNNIYRLPSGDFNDISYSISGNWDDTSLLTNGDALVYNGLRFPTIDFTTGGYVPSQTADYSAFSSDQEYKTTVFDTSPHSNGTLKLVGLILSDLGTNVNIEIKVPTQTGWLDLGTAYNAGSFTGAEGDGCRTSSNGDEFSYTLGSFSTGNSNYRLQVKITFINNNKTISRVSEIGW